jgi:hypothetical protein
MLKYAIASAAFMLLSSSIPSQAILSRPPAVTCTACRPCAEHERNAAGAMYCTKCATMAEDPGLIPRACKFRVPPHWSHRF